MKFQFEEKGRDGRWRTKFSGKLVRSFCVACGRPVTIGAPVCAFHLDEVYGVAIQPEPRLGQGQKGLFATRRFEAGEVIIPYGGELLTSEELEERYGNHTAPYALELSRNYIQDAALVRSAGAHANHYTGLRVRPNARFWKDQRVMWLKAIEPIARGEAILVDYGPDYIIGERTSRYFTSKN